jgi:ABC-2 type transport system ATP-binding protein
MTGAEPGGAVVELRGLTKRFDGRIAVDGMDLTVPAGSIYGLLGPNGAGKTTTIRMVLQILEPDQGEVRLFGAPAVRGVLDRVGYLPEERGIYRRMRVRRALSFFAELKGVSPGDAAPRITHWLDRLELGDRADARVQELSKGMQQKLQFIVAVLHEPDLVILDEPFSGLDPINQRVLKDIVADLRQVGKTVIFCTHMIEHAERLCDHVCIIAGGSKVVDGSVADVKHTHGGRWVAITFEPGANGGPETLGGLPQVRRVRRDGWSAEAELQRDADAQDVLAELVGRGIRMTRFESVEPSLEQIFVDRVGARASTAAGAEEAHV